MKTIKISCIGWHDGFSIYDLNLFNSAKFKKFHIVETNDDPKFVFYGPYGSFEDVLKYPDSIKIFISSYEPVSPDFMFFDYCMGYEPYNFGDRYCYFPMFIIQLTNGTLKENVFKTSQELSDLMSNKCYFCDFIYSHETHEKKRSHYFNLLSTYKRVESVGTFLNNQPNNKTVHYYNNDYSKFEFQSKCKFSLCIQTIDLDWFINEKIVHCIACNTIPIFYGTDKVAEIFNKKRFIDVRDFNSDSDLLERIKQIDNDDELYKQIISEPMFKEDEFAKKAMFKAQDFIFDIFDGKKGKKRNELYAMSKYYNQLQSYIYYYKKMKKLQKLNLFNVFKKMN